nr:TetR/AcrR family transcriptional regulator [uncultured Cetobacterium sp.]
MSKNEKKEQIKNVAKNVLLRKGIFKTRVEDITKEMNIAKGSFYTYYKSKDILLEDLVNDLLEKVVVENKNIEEKISSLEEGLRQFISNRLIIKSQYLVSQLILVNLSRNLEYLGSGIREKLLMLELLNKKTLKNIIKKYCDIDYNEDELEKITYFIMGGIKSYRVEKLFYKNMEEFFISSEEEFREKIKSIDIEKDINWMVMMSLKLLTGGK